MLEGAPHRIVVGLVRRTWLHAAVTVTLCAGFAAHAASSLIDAEDPSPSRAIVAPPRPAGAASRLRPDDGKLVARNMFCSTCEPATGPGPTDPAFSGADVVLIATEVGATQAVSSATVRVVPTEAQGSFAMGEEIPQVGRIAEIERGWIDVVDRGGRHARLSLAETRSRDHAATAGPGAATPAAAAPFADRVRQVDDHTWEVDRGLVKDMVAGVTKPGAVRALPMVVDGEVKGIKLMNVTAGSLPTVFGLKSGDVLTTLDGAPLKTANQVLELYAKLDAVTGVQIGVTRGGAPVEIDLQLK